MYSGISLQYVLILKKENNYCELFLAIKKMLKVSLSLSLSLSLCVWCVCVCVRACAVSVSLY